MSCKLLCFGLLEVGAPRAEGAAVLGRAGSRLDPTGRSRAVGRRDGPGKAGGGSQGLFLLFCFLAFFLSLFFFFL